MKEKVQAVEEVLKKLDQEILQFQSWSGLQCKFGCGKCCFKADIEATILEFLPFAYYLYNDGKAMAWLERMQESDNPVCLILNPTQAGAGLCSEYAYRGLICRLFGYSARTNKYGEAELVTCQIIKTEQEVSYTNAAVGVKQGKNIPIMNQYYMQLHAIDPDLTHEFYPINKAIQKAIETVLHYYAYREE
ncbi:MAG: YkgJ family cysteine cluster protein [Cyclobacteriaceae bacterium]|nr:YkgJ family cysteine cluster protein [Cyclobacteriaceae bacterium]